MFIEAGIANKMKDNDNQQKSKYYHNRDIGYTATWFPPKSKLYHAKAACDDNVFVDPLCHKSFEKYETTNNKTEIDS